MPEGRIYQERMKISSGRTSAFTLSLLLIFLSGCMVCGSSASIAGVMSIEEMTEKADVILVGNVESITHCPADPNDVPEMHRKVQVSVEYYLKNPLNFSEVTVLLLGATIGNTTMWVSDQQEYIESERVLLFLREDIWFLEENPKGYYQGVSSLQGKIKIVADTDMSVFGFNVTDIDVSMTPSNYSEEKKTADFVLFPKGHGERPWYPFIVPLTIVLLLVLMRWRKMIP